jgi:hypothetical protein
MSHFAQLDFARLWGGSARVDFSESMWCHFWTTSGGRVDSGTTVQSPDRGMLSQDTTTAGWADVISGGTPANSQKTIVPIFGWDFMGIVGPAVLVDEKASARNP